MVRLTRGVMGVFCAILLCSSVLTSVNASVNLPVIETYQAQSDSLEIEISKVNQEIEEINKNMGNAHIMAESARALGIPEDDEIIQRAGEIWSENSIKIEELRTNLNELNVQLESVNKYDNYTYAGDFKLTGYCACEKCCDKSPSHPSYGITAMGTRATEGRTVAMDGRFPFGTRVYIEGLGERIVEDRGGSIKGNRIDVYLDSHQACYGAAYNGISKVYVIK